MLAPVPAVPESRTQFVVSRLLDELAAGTLCEGDSLRQADIAQRYGVSATPVREALRILEADGLIDYVPHKGAVVHLMDEDELDDFYRLRAALEDLATSLAVARLTSSGVAQIEAAHRELVDAVAQNAPQTTLSLLNRKFHFAIYEQGSPLAVRQLKQLWAKLSPRIIVLSGEHQHRLLDDDHERIVQAIRDRDALLAGRLVRDHVLSVRSTLNVPSGSSSLWDESLLVGAGPATEESQATR